MIHASACPFHFFGFKALSQQFNKQTTRMYDNADIDVPNSECWRCFLFPIMCCLPPPKAIRVKNMMALKGWSFEKQVPSDTWQGYTSLVFWKYI